MYVVRRNFKGNGHEYKIGEEFEPTGGKWDDEVIRRYCRTVEVEEEVEEQPKPKRTRRKETNDN